ncbi:hypothetical protein ACO0LO_16835 [Undibacterium sp. TJN25]|uniref:hypothetical protein n=1 Tax=Undibacterium sp. TJN25 TaxID=3413056 RepID=UPI003BF27A71
MTFSFLYRAAKFVAIAAFYILSLPSSAAEEITIDGKTYVVYEWVAVSPTVMQFRGTLKAPNAGASKSTTESKTVGASDSPVPSEKKANSVAVSSADPTTAIVKALTTTINTETTLMDSSGLTLLGVTATDINRPVSPRDFAVAIARGSDASGKIKTGAGVEISPFGLFFPDSIVGGTTYEKDHLMQAKARTTIALATAQSDDSKIGNQVAATIRVGLIDKGDPRIIWWSLLDDCSKKYQGLSRIPDPEFDENGKLIPAKEPDEEVKNMKSAEGCYAAKQTELAAKSAWKLPSWYVGAGKAWFTGESGKVQDSRAGAKVLWTSYSQGDYLDKSRSLKGLYQLYAEKKWDDRVQDTTDASKLISETRTDAIARFRFGKTNWNAFVDAGLVRVNTAGVSTQNIRRFGYGAEYKIAEDIWIVVGSVMERGYAAADGKRTLFSTGLRFGQSDKSIFSPDPAPVKSTSDSEKNKVENQAAK